VSPAADPEFEHFVRDCSTSLLRTAVLLSAERERAEDLLQVALLRTHRRWSAARRSPEAYARRVLVNLARDRHRMLARRVAEEPLDRAGSLAADDLPVIRLPDRDAMLEALRQLPVRQREVIVLRFYLDLSVQEVAHAVGCSEGTVKSATARGLDRLRMSLTDLHTPVPTRGDQ
jgi:RNA polymerase sigma-70 factor (sigma-E family)